VFLLSLLWIAVFSYVAIYGARAFRRTDKLILTSFAIFALALLAVEALLVRDFYVAGFLQLIAFVASVIVVRAIFVQAPIWLETSLRRSLLPIHFFLCGYVIVAYLVWLIACVDPSLFAAMTGSTAPAVGYYGFRPSGFDLEPQWTAIALAASYVGVHYLLPGRRAMAFVTLAAASAILASATAAVFLLAVIGSFGVNQIIAARRTGRGFESILAPLREGLADIRQGIWPVLLIFAFATAATLALVVALGLGKLGCHLPVSSPVTTPPGSASEPPPTQIPPQVEAPPAVQVALERATNIVGGRDPSTSQRIISARVAWNVIRKSFPLGVGYGNFRRYAEYPPGFEAYVANLAEDSRYKSDSFVLNYVSELGLLGLVLVFLVAGLFLRTGHGLVIVLLGMLAVLSGTLLVPPLLALAAFEGLSKRDVLATVPQTVQTARRPIPAGQVTPLG
jgi:hypothetical protein